MKTLVFLGWLAATILSAAELRVVGEPARDEFVTVESDTAGRWVVIGPTSITVRQTAEAAGVRVGDSRINFRRVITAEDGKRAHWVGPPGTYAVLQWSADDAEPSHVVVTIPGAPDPQPGPDPPDPTPGALSRIVIVYESASPPKQELLIKLRMYDVHPLLIVDQDSENRELRPIIAAARVVPSVVCLGAGDKILSVTPLPKTYDEFVALVGKHK